MRSVDGLSAADALELALFDKGHADYCRALEEAWRFNVLVEHLQERLSIAQVGALETVSDPLGAVPDLPFGHLHAAWTRFLATLRPDDELWSFAGREPQGQGFEERVTGYAAVRGGTVVASFVTMRVEVEVGSPPE